MEKKSSTKSPFGPQTTYAKWLESEGIDVITGYHLEDLRKLPLKPWERKGGLGVHINLDGAGETNDAYLCEIPPGESLKPQKHLFEELILVLEGGGATTIWNEGGPKHSFEWQRGSLFSIPLNTWHQHFNVRGKSSALYVAVTTAPTVINLFHNHDFVFNNPFIFKDRYDSEEGFFKQEKHHPGRIMETNLVTDVMNVALEDWLARGAGGKNIYFELANNTLCSHISEFPVGTYKKAHRHLPGAHVIILNGKGYSLMWKEGMPFQRFDWQEGSLVVPPDRWFHQHFNSGTTPARYIALRWEGWKYRMGSNRANELCAVSTKEGGDQIEYEDEDPAVRKMFEEELAKAGLEIKMPPILSKQQL